MTAQSWSAGFVVLLVGASIWVMPVLTRPTLQFGVRVPEDRVGAEVIRRERRAYSRRTAILAICFTAATVLFAADSQVLIAALPLLEPAAGLGCFLVAREHVAAAKIAEDWYGGLRQTVAVDTTWRTEPERFPVLWVVPAIAVLVTTVVIGAVRYPHLPDRLAVHFTASGGPDRWAATSIWSAFLPVAIQVFTTGLFIGLLLITFRSRPDVDAADAVGSTRRYRRFLAVTARGMLALAALSNVTVLLIALQTWQVYRLAGLAVVLPVLPVAVGIVALLAIAVRMGQAGSRLPTAAGDQGDSPGVGRDDDRFWTLGQIYVNRDDPALMVGKRFGVGWTLNFGNPTAWLILGGSAVVTTALLLVSVTAGR